MIEDELSYVNTIIFWKKNSLNKNKLDLDNTLANFKNGKRGINKTNDAFKKFVIKTQMKIDLAKIKQLKKEMSITIKEINIYESEYKKKRKDPNYNINFKLLKREISKIIWTSAWSKWD